MSWVSGFLLPSDAFSLVFSMERLKIVESLTSFSTVHISKYLGKIAQEFDLSLGRECHLNLQSPLGGASGLVLEISYYFLKVQAYF